MERYTKVHAEAAFHRLITAIGGRIAKGYGPENAGAFYLEKWGSKYRVSRYSNTHGGVSQPFGSSWRNAREFTEYSYFAQTVIWTEEELKKEGESNGSHEHSSTARSQ